MELKNVGVMNQKQMNIAINNFKKVGAVVKQDNNFVSANFDNSVVFSANKLEEGTWHVKAIKGLLKKDIPH